MSRMYLWVAVLGFCLGTWDRDKHEAAGLRAESYQRAVCLIRRGCVCSQLRKMMISLKPEWLCEHELQPRISQGRMWSGGSIRASMVQSGWDPRAQEAGGVPCFSSHWF